MLVKDYGSEIDWNIGALFSHDDELIEINKICNSVGENSNIKYVFGGIPCIMQGGRVPPQNMSLENALAAMDKYNENNVGCRLTFSNPMITRGDLADGTSNALLNKLDINNRSNPKNKNGVIVESDLLADYIKYMYPNLELISSQVKPSTEVGLGNDTAEYYNNLLDRFDIVVVNPAKIHDNEFLNSLKDHERVEFIVNHRCLPNCPMSGKHYALNVELAQLIASGENMYETQEKLTHIYEYCKATRNANPCAGSTMSVDDIKMLVSKGFRHFKVEGRENHVITWARDLGDYIFNHEIFARVLASVYGTSV